MNDKQNKIKTPSWKSEPEHSSVNNGWRDSELKCQVETDKSATYIETVGGNTELSIDGKREKGMLERLLVYAAPGSADRTWVLQKCTRVDSASCPWLYIMIKQDLKSEEWLLGLTLTPVCVCFNTPCWFSSRGFVRATFQHLLWKHVHFNKRRFLSVEVSSLYLQIVQFVKYRLILRLSNTDILGWRPAWDTRNKAQHHTHFAFKQYWFVLRSI